MEALYLVSPPNVLMIALIMSATMMTPLFGQGSINTGFYSSSCPKAESIVRSTVEEYYNKDATLAAGLLRMHFHDCFVQGCDGSVLIDTPTSERKAFPNLGLRGFQVIDDAKSKLEAACPGVVSCADILALAARDSVDLAGGPNWGVPTGRRDGRISLSSEVSNLPSPFDTIEIQKQKFADKGLDDYDLVTLVGAHTLGQTSCRLFQYRLYNFTITGNADPSISQSSLAQLQSICPKDGDGSRRVALDQNSELSFDVSFFKNVRDGNAILESDQRLYGDSSTRQHVDNFASKLKGLLGLRFSRGFSKSMVKMSSIEVKTGAQGEIRRLCYQINQY